MRTVFWLSDEAWSAIEPLLPSNQPCARRVDDRRIISGIIHVLQSGCRWRDCPGEYGPCTTVYNRFNRWNRRKVWQRIYAALVEAGRIGGTVALDSTHVRVHRSAAGAQKKLGRQSWLDQGLFELGEEGVWVAPEAVAHDPCPTPMLEAGAQGRASRPVDGGELARGDGMQPRDHAGDEPYGAAQDQSR